MKKDQLTQRQIDVLKAIITEYINGGKPVGSEVLEKKYQLGFSPATIRNEMVELARKGFILKNYFSSGRIPSGKAIKFYINNLMEEKELSTKDEVAYKNSIWDEKSELHKLLLNSSKILAERTGKLSLVVTDEGDIYYAGVSHILEGGGVQEMEQIKEILSLVEEWDFWSDVLVQLDKRENNFTILLGEEGFKDSDFSPFAGLISGFKGKNVNGILGVLGNKRMRYSLLIPQLKYFSKLLDNIIVEQGW